MGMFEERNNMRVSVWLVATLLASLGAPALRAQGIISTIAGNGNIGYTGDGGPATSATLGSANGIVVDKAGNIYFADSIFSVVRKVNSKGIISTFAGGAGAASLGDGGPATSARLSFQGPHAGLAVDGAGNVYIADYIDSRIRKVDTSGNNHDRGRQQHISGARCVFRRRRTGHQRRSQLPHGRSAR